MNTLNSCSLDCLWLINKLEKSAKAPKDRLLNLFEILAGWINTYEYLATESDCILQADTANSLLNYLTEQAKASGAHLPELLAQQLYFMALGVLQEALKNHPQHNSHATFMHAKQAAQALVEAQTQRRYFNNRSLIYGLAASLFVMVGVTNMLVYRLTTKVNQVAILNANFHQTNSNLEELASPSQTAAMYASIEAMRKGVCQLPQALMMPESERAVYLQNVVAGEVSANANDQAVASKLMEKVQCDYAPMLMKNSTS